MDLERIKEELSGDPIYFYSDLKQIALDLIAEVERLQRDDKYLKHISSERASLIDSLQKENAALKEVNQALKDANAFIQEEKRNLKAELEEAQNKIRLEHGFPREPLQENPS